jgi:hypothetical protein
MQEQMAGIELDSERQIPRFITPTEVADSTISANQTETVKNSNIIEEDCADTNRVYTEMARPQNASLRISYEGKGPYAPDQDPDGTIRQINKETRNLDEFTQSVDCPPSTRKDVEKLRLSSLH